MPERRRLSATVRARGPESLPVRYRAGRPVGLAGRRGMHSTRVEGGPEGGAEAPEHPPGKSPPAGRERSADRRAAKMPTRFRKGGSLRHLGQAYFHRHRKGLSSSPEPVACRQQALENAVALMFQHEEQIAEVSE